MKKAYFAGGCFWAVEHYFSLIKGVVDVKSGYAQSVIESPTYESVCKDDVAVETVVIEYDELVISYLELIKLFFKIIDPTSINKQGVDSGPQYRSGIYCLESNEIDIANSFIESIKNEYSKPIVVEVEMLKNFVEAEDYHQDYYVKHPNVSCHIDFNNLTIEKEYLK